MPLDQAIENTPHKVKSVSRRNIELLSTLYCFVRIEFFQDNKFKQDSPESMKMHLTSSLNLIQIRALS